MPTVLDRMKQIMASENYSIGQFYADFNVANSSFTGWKRSKDGYPPASILAKFSQRFGVSVDYLLFGTDSASENQLDFSSLNEEDELLLAKFHSLPTRYQIRLMGYIDGMLDSTKFKLDT